MKRTALLCACLILLGGCAASREFRPLSAAALCRQLEQAVGFGFDSDRVNQATAAVLDQEASALKQHKKVKLILEGHADSVGSNVYNLELGDRRARGVLVELISRGVDPAQLIVVSQGEGNPKAPNATASGREQNRRVELIVRK